MSAPAGIPPRPAAAPGGARAPEAAARAPPCQNGPMQNPMQFPFGYGLHLENYSASSGRYPQVPQEAVPSQLNNQYVADYHSACYSIPVQSVITPSVGPSMLNTQQPQQLYSGAAHPVESAGGLTQGAISSASHLHTGVPQSYSALSSHCSSSTSSSVASQGFPLSSGHYAMPTVSSAVYPNLSYPSMSIGSPYGQVFTSQSLPAVGQFEETNAFPGPSSTVPRTLPHQVPLGYNSTSWSTSDFQSAQDNFNRNHTGSLAKASNQINTVGIVDSSHPVSQNVQFTKPGVETSVVSSAVTSSIRTPVSDHLTEAASVPSNKQPSEPLLQEETNTATSSPAPTPQTSRTPKPFGYGYPTLQPGYQNAAPPTSAMQPNNPGPHSGFQQYPQYPGVNQLSSTLGGLSLQHSQQPESLRPVNLTQDRNILPVSPVLAPVPNLNSDLKKLNCSPDSFRCTLTNIPQTQALLNKAKLPLGLLLHPFRDLTQLPVITSSTIVRCRSCRTYINPFVAFIDQRRWKCNLCYRVNDVPEEFMYNPLTRSYGEPHKRPEVQNSTVEFIASSDYMLRPPQPAVYLFVLDVSHNAVEAGYLTIVCQSLLENLDKLPGDSRTRIGFITFDSTVQFYNLQEGLSQPQMLIVSDIDDVFLPTPDSLLVNLHESKELIKDLLNALPNMFTNTRETHSALGPALQAAFKLMSPTGGRISVFQSQLPSLGSGFLHSREDPNQRSSTKVVQHLGPATDFYKKLALDCSGQQTAVDLFLLSSQYSDLASLACMSKYSAGCIYYYPSFHHSHNPAQAEKLQKDLKRYLTRKIGFEAVMRIRCTKGLSIHTFHGNLFVRSTDLLSLANVNPDAGFAVQMSIEESLTGTSLVCFQTALLYTSSKGERRIRVHTLCLPVVTSLADVYAGADVQAVVCLLANMAVDRSVSSSLSDARDALVNAVVDSLSAYISTASNLQQSTLIAPNSLRLFPLYVLALLKQKAFRTGTSTRLDDRIYAMCQIKSQPLVQLMKMIHPNLYRIDRLTSEGTIHVNDRVVPQPPLQKLSAEKLTREGAFLMDCGSIFYIWIGKSCDNSFIKDVLGYTNYASVPQKLTQLPELDTLSSERARSFISWLRDSRPLSTVLQVIKDESPAKTDFFQHLVEDRTEAAFSYYEFLLHIQQQICK
ncbi:protein transport protein Sec24B isoform X7 [Dermochelys coriacea]|uniref:protein transport protein Sec24B isoform X7 n=1 Tax=Dermochelys coriacea TaxID=27794 RepID=UPI001CA96345|nr:protein transport protein Sec24B isoform X7 [Dermochelys coriacea]